MENEMLTPEQLENINRVFETPKSSLEFQTALRSRIQNTIRESQIGHDNQKAAEMRNRRIGWSFAGVASIFAIALVLAVGPQKVVTAMRELFGYIPGVGVVRPEGLRILAEPVEFTDTRIQFRLNQVIADYTETKVEFTWMFLEKVTPPAASSDATSCTRPPLLRIPDGTELAPRYGGGAYGSEMEAFDPLPRGVLDLSLIIQCLPTQDGISIPANLEVPFHLAYNTAAATSFLVQQMTPSINPTSSSTGSTALQKVSLNVENMVETGDGYIIIGHFHSEDPAFSIIPFWPSEPHLYDSTGAEIPIEQAEINSGAIPEGEFAYKVRQKYFHGPLTIRFETVLTAPHQNISFKLDLGASPQDGQEWKLNRDLTVYGYPVRLESVIYRDPKDIDYQELELKVQASPEIVGLFIRPNIDAGGEIGQPGGEAAKRALGGSFTALVGLSPHTSGVVSFEIDQVTLAGSWSATWNPPVVEGALSPTPIPQACLTNDSWGSIRTGPVPPIPADVTGRILISRSNSTSGQELFLAGLNGQGSKILKDGIGDGSLSPDGRRLTFVDSEGKLWIEEMESGKSALLMEDAGIAHPVWSPDGQWIGYYHLSGGDPGVFIVHPDGSERQVIEENPFVSDISGWSPDASLVYILKSDGANSHGSHLFSINRLTRESNPLLPDVWMQGAAISPDGEWISYQKQEFGRNGAWLSLSRLDGSDRKLLLRLDGRWGVLSSIWNPDGNWLAAYIYDSQFENENNGEILIDRNTCQVIPLSGLGNRILSWIR